MLLAILPIMLLFLVQFVLDQQTEAKISMIDSYVYTAKEYAKQSGYLDCKALKDKIVSSCGLSDDDVSVSSNASDIDTARTRLSSANVSGGAIDLERASDAAVKIILNWHCEDGIFRLRNIMEKLIDDENVSISTVYETKMKTER